MRKNGNTFSSLQRAGAVVGHCYYLAGVEVIVRHVV